MSKTMNDQAKYQRERADRLQAEVAAYKSENAALKNKTWVKNRMVPAELGKLQAEVERLRDLLSQWYVRTAGRPQQLLDDTANALEGK